jgi:thymidylate synthase ThyX
MKVTILNKSINSATEDVITSFLLEGFPYDILAEFNKHRLFSTSCSSSRAVPFHRSVEQIIEDPFVPVFTKNQPGMSGEIHEDQMKAEGHYLNVRDYSVSVAKLMDKMRVHKQDINGILKPWMKVSQIVTSTHWDNFFTLRRGDGAKGVIREFANEMYRSYFDTAPNILKLGDWHMPYPELSLRENVAKCGSISYANHQKDATKEDLIKLHDKLYQQKHSVPLEHCAMAIQPGYVLEDQSGSYCQVFDHFDMVGTLESNDAYYSQIDVGNFSGFLQYRKFLEYDIPVSQHHPNV